MLNLNVFSDRFSVFGKVVVIEKDTGKIGTGFFANFNFFFAQKRSKKNSNCNF